MLNYFINSPNNIIISNLTTDILRDGKAFAYHKSLSVYQSTPLVSLPNLAQKYNVGNIYVKKRSHVSYINFLGILEKTTKRKN